MYIGIDLGGTKIAAGLVNQRGKLILKKSIPTKAERGASAIISDMADLALTVTKMGGKTMDDIKHVGVGSPGHVDTETGTLVSASNLPFKSLPMRDMLCSLLNKPVFIENDANCAALAESKVGAAKGTKHSLTVTLGTGVGGGIIINKKIYAGFNHAGGEFGHMVIAIDGKKCTCGKSGCFEAYASASGLINISKEKALLHPESLMWQLLKEDGNFSGKTAFNAAKNGDLAGMEAVNEYINYLAQGIINLIVIFQPEVIAIGGGVSNEGEGLFLPLIRKINEILGPSSLPKTKIVQAKLGNDAGIIGASMLEK
ncbi:MAG: ROK family glucokinase [Bacillota bacterium]|nr:ROK family glucokinase [Bacillota bacterium]